MKRGEKGEQMIDGQIDKERRRERGKRERGRERKEKEKETYRNTREPRNIHEEMELKRLLCNRCREKDNIH